MLDVGGKEGEGVDPQHPAAHPLITNPCSNSLIPKPCHANPTQPTHIQPTHIQPTLLNQLIFNQLIPSSQGTHISGYLRNKCKTVQEIHGGKEMRDGRGREG